MYYNVPFMRMLTAFDPLLKGGLMASARAVIALVTSRP